MKNTVSEDKLPLITLISSTVFIKWLVKGISEIYEELGRLFRFKTFFLNELESEVESEAELVNTLYSSDIILLDIRGNSPVVETIVNTFQEMERTNSDLFEEKEIISLVGGNSEIRRLTKMGAFKAKKIPGSSDLQVEEDEIPDLTDAVRFGKRMTKMMKVMGRILPFKVLKHARYWGLMMDYWVYGLGGVPENHKNMLLFLLKKYLGYEGIDVKKPIKLPQFGIYDPRLEKYFEDLDDYLGTKYYNSRRNTIGIFFYGGLYFEQSIPIVKSFIDFFEGYNIIPVFSDTLTNLEAHKKFFFQDDDTLVDIVINLQYFQLNGGPFGGDSSETLKLYEDMDVPHLNPIIQFDNTYENYLNSNQGMIPINQIIAVVMPELDGRYEMQTVGLMENLGYSKKVKADILEIKPLKNNIQLIAERVKKWIALRTKQNSEKKVAIIIYNYPPGEDKIGNAAYLNVSESIKNLLDNLIKNGYNAEKLDSSLTLSETFIEKGLINLPKYVNNKRFSGISISKEEYVKYFKTLPKDMQEKVMETWGIPPGNIMVKDSKILLPILKLKNIYLCLQPSRSSDSNNPEDYHDKNLAPHHQYLAFYKYLEKKLDVDAIVHIGTHGTEEFLPGKENAGYFKDFNINLIGNLPNIYYYHVTNTSESAIAKRRSNALIINHAGPTLKDSSLYEQFEHLDSLISQYHNLKQKSESLNDSEHIEDLKAQINELAQSLNLNYNSMMDLENKLYTYKTSTIPMGLHTLGKKYTLEEKTDLILMILMNSIHKPPEIALIESKFGKKYPNQKGSLTRYLKMILKSSDIDSLIDYIQEKDFLPKLSEENHRMFIKWVRKLNIQINTSGEMENIIHALNGGYVEPGLGGDPIRTPEIFPTGKNSYGFDPRLIPNTIAYKRGNTVAERLLEDHKKKYGKWPETVSVVLWAFETMKTGGETIGQIFNYLGVKPVKNKAIWTTELEVIPLEEMNHPRINVITTICGIFRDTFPYLLDLLNQAVELVSQLDEPIDKNFVRKSINDLKQKNIVNADARIFGPPPGKYNTNLTNIISDGRWTEEKELAADYINNMSYSYMKNQKVKKSQKAFRENISRINLMSQIRDSSEYHITDVDHYYEFTGGLAKSYQEITGKKANVFIADTSSKEIQVNSLNETIKEASITRNLNPRWINSLLKHKYHGGQKIAEKVENLLGMAATTHEVDNWIWDKSYDQYIENEEIKDALIDNNKFAMMDLIKNMLQADERGYWEATEAQKNNLKKLYLDLENWVEMSF
ncbi:MAG: hypothetical protein BAJALOKI2v1_80023 [Promethearchaeota archaeon]|nr:MAG: hypothetical protein BAJALOKI2v1_80023 [Candidatus Lokiarchaeota archaeon]